MQVAETATRHKGECRNLFEIFEGVEVFIAGGHFVVVGSLVTGHHCMRVEFRLDRKQERSMEEYTQQWEIFGDSAPGLLCKFTDLLSVLNLL